jgi:hypothetical protein
MMVAAPLFPSRDRRFESLAQSLVIGLENGAF